MTQGLNGMPTSSAVITSARSRIISPQNTPCSTGTPIGASAMRQESFDPGGPAIHTYSPGARPGRSTGPSWQLGSVGGPGTSLIALRRGGVVLPVRLRSQGHIDLSERLPRRLGLPCLPAAGLPLPEGPRPPDLMQPATLCGPTPPCGSFLEPGITGAARPGFSSVKPRKTLFRTFQGEFNEDS